MPAALALIAAEHDLDAPIPHLTALLAQAIVAEHGDAVLVVRPAPADTDTRGRDLDCDDAGLDRLTLPLPADPEARAEILLDRLRPLLPRYALVLVPADAPLVHAVGAPAGLAVRRVALHRAVHPPAWATHPARLLPLREPTRGGLALARRLLHRAPADLRPLAPLAHACRLRLDLDLLGDRPFARLPDPARRALARWARAVTHRLVGVAVARTSDLALLRALDARGVPIDLLAAQGPGALVAAYRAALGPAGLDRAAARRLDLLALAPPLAEATAALDLGDVALEDLETPLALASPALLTRGPVAAALRAALPGRGAEPPLETLARMRAALAVTSVADAEGWPALAAPR
jgi:hypothetical protein